MERMKQNIVVEEYCRIVALVVGDYCHWTVVVVAGHRFSLKAPGDHHGSSYWVRIGVPRKSLGTGRCLPSTINNDIDVDRFNNDQFTAISPITAELPQLEPQHLPSWFLICYSDAGTEDNL